MLYTSMAPLNIFQTYVHAVRRCAAFSASRRARRCATAPAVAPSATSCAVLCSSLAQLRLVAYGCAYLKGARGALRCELRACASSEQNFAHRKVMTQDNRLSVSEGHLLARACPAAVACCHPFMHAFLI